MSTLATADLGPSDDEADGDFVLAAPKPKKKTAGKGKRPRSGSASSGSSSDSDSGDEGEPENDLIKKLREEREEAETAARKKRAAEAFAAMQAEALAPTRTTAPKVEEVEMVEIQRPRRFAGETIYETVKLPKNDPEAIRYLAKHASANGAATEAAPASETANATPSASSEPAASDAATAHDPSSLPAPTSTQPLAASTASMAPTTSSSTPKPLPRRPVRKRPRQSLEAMSAALDQGKKMTTLEKSQMDWNSHMSKEASLADEISAHRKRGGFLEKQAFLERVGERRGMPPSASGSSGRKR